jgi:hypothetical protein
MPLAKLYYVASCCVDLLARYGQYLIALYAAQVGAGGLT